jgi:hypothetical protein
MGRSVRYLLATAMAGVLALAPGAVSARSATHTYQVFGEANVGVAANGDTIRVTCEAGAGQCGTFSVHPKAIDANGEFEHLDAAGNLLAAGTWRSTQLLSYHSYGCGVVLGEPLPADFCGGALKFSIVASTPLGDVDGVLTIFCIVGPKAPGSHDDPSGEGVTLVVPGIANFNHTGGGDNIFIQTS